MDNVAYYRRRLEDEQKRIASAADPQMAEIHAELARLYELLIEALERTTDAA